jgi:DNA polymerase-1
MPDPVVVQRIEQLEGLVRKIVAAGGVSVDTETTSTDPVAARLVGISLCVDPQTVAYLPVAHRGEGQVQLPLAEVKRVLGPVLADPQLKKTGQHFKYDQVVLQSHGFAVDGLAFDSMLASYVLNPSRLSHGLDALAAEFLGVRTISYKEVTSRGGEQVLFDLVPVRDAARYSGEDAWVALLLREKLVPMVEQAGLASLLYDVEVPLSSVLAGMELCGVKVDVERLHALSREFEARLLTIEREVHQLAGAPFNIGSPKQLGEVLFEKLQLPTRKKTKTGYSTDVQVLEELASLHPLPARVLEYRSLSKLKSTYADVLPTLVNPKTGRVHTSFNQAATATGRLSSSDPNLQNIPVRQDEGRKIREAFIHEPGRVLLSADYSQIELRVLAHLCGDKTLMAAFRSGEDIHTRTAAEIFHVLPGLVTRQQRGMAKTVNFGILYGMSAFRLSREYGISNKEAKAFIDAYFARYPKVKEFADRTVRQAAETGMVETLLKRRRYVPEVRAQAAQVRAAGERIAVNTPVQGSAADIVKLAMLALERRLRDARLPAAMVLQVHDELVLEVAAGREKEVAEVVRDAMEKVLTLDVPLKVDVGTGDNWAQIH